MEQNYSIKVILTDLRSGEELDWFVDFQDQRLYAEMEFEHLCNAHQTFNY